MLRANEEGIDEVVASSKLILFSKIDYAIWIIEGDSTSNITSQELIEKLYLKTEKHLNPY